MAPYKAIMTRNKALFPLLLVFAFTALSQTLPEGVRKITAVEGITEYALPNGLHVLLFPDSSKPNVTVNMTYMVGSRQEGYGETGMAHLLEHMLFLQTTTRKDVQQELKDHGAEMNGSTAWDRTNYFETLNASDENLKFALELEADRMVNSKIEKPLLDTEMTVVRNEFEMRENSPEGMLRSEEHTSELQSLRHLVCRLLLEKNRTRTRRPRPDPGGRLRTASCATSGSG